MYIPSFDFRIFDLPSFSPLQAQEFGAETSFSANTPLSYVDFSLNQFANLLRPNTNTPYIQNQFPIPIDGATFENYFQGVTRSRAEIEALAKQQSEEFEKAKADVTAPKTCPEGYKPVSVFGIFSYCGKGLKSDGDQTLGDKTAPPGMQSLETFLNAIPQGAGIFLIALVVIILIFLFVRR
jgi:hypothetical protein